MQQIDHNTPKPKPDGLTPDMFKGLEKEIATTRAEFRKEWQDAKAQILQKVDDVNPSGYVIAGYCTVAVLVTALVCALIFAGVAMGTAQRNKQT